MPVWFAISGLVGATRRNRGGPRITMPPLFFADARTRSMSSGPAHGVVVSDGFTGIAVERLAAFRSVETQHSPRCRTNPGSDGSAEWEHFRGRHRPAH